MSEISKLPRHVAIIMDGNGRWAKAHKLQVAQGHRRGTETLRSIIRESSDLGIEALSLYAFSTENWKRSPAEVGALMSLLLEYFTSEIDELDEKNVCIRILGDKDGLPGPQKQALIAAENRTRDNTGLKLNIAKSNNIEHVVISGSYKVLINFCSWNCINLGFTRSCFKKLIYSTVFSCRFFCIFTCSFICCLFLYFFFRNIFRACSRCSI